VLVATQKIATVYVQLPTELRYYSNPANPNKSWKAAVGVKLGTLLKGYTKSKNYLRVDGSTVYGSDPDQAPFLLVKKRREGKVLRVKNSRTPGLQHQRFFYIVC
jgi:hypothetical protein